VYRASGWNTRREADYLLRDLREQSRVAFAAVDSSVLETAPDDPRGAIVLETEMHRAKSPDGEDWGAPSWRWFRPTPAGRCAQLEALTEGLIRGVQRVNGLGFTQVLALVNPTAYFLALAAAVAECGLLDRWVLFRVPAHSRHLLKAVREIVPVVRAAAVGTKLAASIYPIPVFLSAIRHESHGYWDPLLPQWRKWGKVSKGSTDAIRWAALIQSIKVDRAQP
jgi:hypothetical protein